MNNNTLLVTFNTCGLGSPENVDHYIKVIHQLLSQNFNNYRVVLSSCCNSDKVRQTIQKEFGNTISYNFIDDIVPVPVSFNDTVLESVKRWKKFDGYLYVESGLDFEQNTTILKELYDLMKSGPYSIISGRVDTDHGYIENGINIQNNKDHTIIPVGKALNGHIHIFSNKILQYYGQCWPSIFSGHCNESVMTFLCAALKTNWVLLTKSVIHHIEYLDKRSAGFDIPGWVASGRPTWDHPFIIPSIVQRICTQECWNAGLGYEEVKPIMMHRPDQFDENGFCINDKLREICKTKLFLQPDEFDYDKINHTYIK